MARQGAALIGSSYYLPHHAPADWDRDFARMAAAGHTVVRTGELLASWDHLEQHPGQPDFTALDEAFALATAHGMAILLGTGACCPPAWLLERHPDLPIVDRDGIAYPAGAMWSWACINHPAYLEESDRFLRQLLERYGKHPALHGWQVHNEPGYPFIPREDRPAPAWYDYNPHTVAAFRTWLRDRYGTIDRLNAAWRWVPTNLRHAGFASVPAPRATPAEWGSPAAWLDWRRFTCANWDQLLRRQHDLIKSVTPAAVTMTNILGAALDTDGRLGIDSWGVARQCDVIGYDLYPGMHMPAAAATGRPPAGDPRQPAWFLDFARSTARHARRPLWVPELESGPLAGWAAGPQHATTAADIRRWGTQALSRGARLVLFQGYREWASLPMHWGALAGWEGEATPRLEAAGQLARLAADLGDVVEPVPARVGILHAHDNVLHNAGCGLAGLVHDAMRGMHAIMHDLHVAVDFIPPARLAADHGHDLLLLPFMALLDADTAAMLARFVEAGGRLVSMPLTAAVDGGCQVWARRPGGGLDAVLGVREVGLEVADDITIEWQTLAGKGITAAGRHHRQALAVAPDTQVLATFADGSPAATMRAHGAGLAVHVATHLDLAATAGAGNPEPWRDLLARLGIRPGIEVTPAHAGLDCVLTQVGPRKVLFVANAAARACAATLSVPGLQTARCEHLGPAGAARPGAAPDGGTGCRIEVELPAWEALAVALG